MKQGFTKKILSLVICIALLLSLLPMTEVIADENTPMVEGSTLIAYAAGNAPVLDGSLTDAVWHMSNNFTGTLAAKFGVTWSRDNLYVAISAAEGEVFTLEIAGKTVVYNIPGDQFQVNDIGAQGAATVLALELALPWSSLGITPTNGTNFGISFELSKNESISSFVGRIILSGKTIYFADAMNSQSEKGWASYNLEPDDVSCEFDNEMLHLTNSYNEVGGSDARVPLLVNRPILPGSTAYDIEFDFQIMDLIKVHDYHAVRGVLITLGRSDKEATYLCFSRGEEDKVLVAVQTDNSGNRWEKVQTDIPIGGDDWINIRIRLQDGKAILYANNEQKAYFEVGSFLYSSENFLQFMWPSVGAQTDPDNGEHIINTYIDNLKVFDVNTTYYEEIINKSIDMLTFDIIKGENIIRTSITSPLSLETQWEIKDTEDLGKLTWESSNIGILNNDGTLTGESGWVILTAKLEFRGFQGNKEFLLYIGEQESEPEGKLIAYRPAVTPIIDGKLKDAAWYMAKDFTGSVSGSAGVLWDEENLYFAISSANAKMLNIIINGETITYDIINRSFDTNNIGAFGDANNGTVELVIPWSGLGIAPRYFFQTDFSCVISDEGWTSHFITTLELTNQKIYLGDSCSNITEKGWKRNEIMLGTGEGSSSITAEDGAYIFYNDANNEEDVGYLLLNGLRTEGSEITSLDFLADEFDLEFDFTARDMITCSKNYGWRGLYFELCATTTEDLLMALARGEDDKVVIYLMDESFATTNIPINGEKVHLRFHWAVKDNMLTLYINGEKDISMIVPTFARHGNFLRVEAVNAIDDMVGNGEHITDVSIDNFLIYESTPITVAEILEEELENLTFNKFKGDNLVETLIQYPLELPTQLYAKNLGAFLEIDWASSNTSIISQDGQLRGESGYVLLTANVTYEGLTTGRKFLLKVPTVFDKKKVGLLKNDMDPYTGSLKDFESDEDLTLDNKYTSVGLDLGEKIQFNRIVLYDLDANSQITKKDLSIYISDDNVNYSRVKDWSMNITDGVYTIYNLDETARYIKVHCHIEGMTGDFSNNLKNMMDVYYDSNWIYSNGGIYTHKNTITIMNSEDKVIYDKASYFTIEELKLNPAYCKADFSDVRFVLNNKLLYHYFDGDGFYIRIPKVSAKSTKTLLVYYGNPNALSISDAATVFEVEYGNTTVYSLRSEGFGGDIMLGLMPNDDLLTFYDTTGVAYRRSKNGGRTWGNEKQIYTSPSGHVTGSGGRLIDYETGEVFYLYFSGGMYSVPTPDGLPDMNLYIVSSMDNGNTWSEPYKVVTDKSYSLTYANGIKTSIADGDGPNVDYVWPFAYAINGTDAFNASTIYSKDGGKTWITSKSSIYYPGADAGREMGISESAIVELSDGRLMMIARCAFAGNIKFALTYSDDYGVTWIEESELSNIYAPFTMPVLFENEEDVVLMWAGNNAMSGPIERYPLTMAYSPDKGETWLKKLDLFYGTSLAGVNTSEHRSATEPDFDYSKYKGSDDGFIFFTDASPFSDSIGILIEDFNDKLYKTQGAYDSFEGTSISREGWLNVIGAQELVTGIALDGNQSIKITSSKTGTSRISRTIPSISKGSINFSTLFESMDSGFAADFKTTYSNLGFVYAPFAFRISETGKLIFVDTKTKEEIVTDITIPLLEWTNYQIDFDFETKNAELFIDGVSVGTMPFYGEIGEDISVVQFVGEAKSVSNTAVFIDVFKAVDKDEKQATLLSATVKENEPQGDFTITAIAGAGGIIYPSESVSVVKGGNKTFYIVADSGYTVDNVKVDGVSLGAISTYTFENVQESHTIEAAFKSAGGITVIVDSGKGGNDKDEDDGKDDKDNKDDKDEMDETGGKWENPFTDTSGHWAEEAISFVVKNDIFKGVSTNTFSPNTNMTRAMFVTVLGRLYENLKGSKANATSSVSKFADVVAGGYYEEYVIWATKNGIIYGYDSGKFGVKDSITRQDICVILTRFLTYLDYDLSEYKDGAEFADSDYIKDYAKEAVKICRAASLVNGVGENKFNPNGKATRAEIATIIANFARNFS